MSVPMECTIKTSITFKCGFTLELAIVMRDIFVVGMGSGPIQDRHLEEDASKISVTYSSSMEIATNKGVTRNDQDVWTKRENMVLKCHKKSNKFNQGKRGSSASKEFKLKYGVYDGCSNH